jgi:hypothetical protein
MRIITESFKISSEIIEKKIKFIVKITILPYFGYTYLVEMVEKYGYIMI